MTSGSLRCIGSLLPEAPAVAGPTACATAGAPLLWHSAPAAPQSLNRLRIPGAEAESIPEHCIRLLWLC